MESIWYKTKSISSDLKDANLYPYEQWTLLTKIVVGGFFFVSFLFALFISVYALSAAAHAGAKAAADTAAAAAASTANAAQQPPPPKPNLFIRLGDVVEGLDPCSTPPASPAFQLVVDADWIPPRYRYCSGGGNSMLRVSHRGIILAWGPVPWFCVEGSQNQSEADGYIDGVVTVQARADGAVLRQEVRSSVHSDLCAEGKARFSMEGEVAGLGYLRCETSLFQGNTTEDSGPCLVQ